MAVVARVLDVPQELNQSGLVLRFNRWGPPLWPADEPLDRLQFAPNNELPLEVWLLAALGGLQQ